MIHNNYIAFLYGVLVKIVDDINDFHIFTEYKLIFEIALTLFTIYVVFFNTILSPISSCTFTLGGFIALLLIPHSVDATIWQLIILLSIPKCIHLIPKFITVYKGLNLIDMRNISSFVLPLLLIATTFSVIEDIIVPEETGYKKLIDKAFQSFIMILFLLLIKFISQKINLHHTHKQLLIILASGWLGYALTSVIILTLFINK